VRGTGAAVEPQRRGATGRPGCARPAAASASGGRERRGGRDIRWAGSPSPAGETPAGTSPCPGKEAGKGAGKGLVAVLAVGDRLADPPAVPGPSLTRQIGRLWGQGTP